MALIRGISSSCACFRLNRCTELQGGTTESIACHNNLSNNMLTRIDTCSYITRNLCKQVATTVMECCKTVL